MDKAPVFLSASVPERELDRFVPDPVAIREAVRALVAETVRDRLLVFGGHPAISPLVEHAAQTLGAMDQVRIYQSEFFRNVIPEVAKKFPHLVWTPAVPGDLKASLTAMRGDDPLLSVRSRHLHWRHGRPVRGMGHLPPGAPRGAGTAGRQY